MIRCRRLQHRFVETIPEVLEPGVLYVSLEYCTATHSCCCGCGEEVVTPLSPVGWEMSFNGETVSLWPSIGNWTLPCRSHYVIDHGSVQEALPWSDAQVAAAQRREKSERQRHFDAIAPVSPTMPSPPTSPTPAIPPPPVPTSGEATSWWLRLRERVFGPRRTRPE